MTYDVQEGPPRSVEVQRRLEAFLEEHRTAITALAILAVAGYVLSNLEPSSSSTAISLEDVTIGEVAKWVAIAIVAGVALTVNIAIHELCHWLAFRYYGIRAEWTLDWLSVRGREVYPFAVAGLCWGNSLESYRLSYLEDLVVSLAPLVWAAILLAPLSAYHLLVAPIEQFWLFAGAIFVLSGPSPPDWAFLLETPREKWDDLVDLEERLDRHAIVEGTSVPR